MVSAEEKTFNYEVAEKKKMVRSARKKKNGSRSKKCNLGSDRLSRKEWEKMNGKVTTYDFKRAYTWEDFKQLPYSVQAAFLDSVIRNYSVTPKMLSTMFNRKVSTVMTYIRKHHYKVYAIINANTATDEQQDEFDEFIDTTNTDTELFIATNNVVQLDLSKEPELIDWDEFRALPKDVFVNFLIYVRETYDASYEAIASLFNISHKTIGYHVRKTGELTECFNKQRRMTSEKQEQLKEFATRLDIDFIRKFFDTTVSIESVRESVNNIGRESITDVDIEYDENEIDEFEIDEDELLTMIAVEEGTSMTTENKPVTPVSTKEFTWTMEGELDIDALCATLKMVVGTNKVKLSISCESID